ncbi:MAG TPA: hypothetical protein VF444_13215 [Pseudonocardiaceae bacterium]
MSEPGAGALAGPVKVMIIRVLAGVTPGMITAMILPMIPAMKHHSIGSAP